MLTERERGLANQSFKMVYKEDAQTDYVEIIQNAIKFYLGKGEVILEEDYLPLGENVVNEVFKGKGFHILNNPNSTAHEKITLFVAKACKNFYGYLFNQGLAIREVYAIIFPMLVVGGFEKQFSIHMNIVLENNYYNKADLSELVYEGGNFIGIPKTINFLSLINNYSNE